MNPPFALKINRHGQCDIEIVWNDGLTSVHKARDLRLACSCAACVEEMTGHRIVRDEDVPADVQPLKISLVGRYGIHIQWSDGHTTGIYGFEYLKRLSLNPHD